MVCDWKPTAAEVEELNLQYCEVPITVDDEMEAPVYIYYELDNYYQNHRKYVKSKDVN